MDPKLEQQVADSLDAPVELIPYLPELLADFWSLGTSPEVIVRILRPLGLRPIKTRVLDLGCGKGAVASALARELGLHVLGIDAFEPFIQEACQRAIEIGAGTLCQFEASDLFSKLDSGDRFDVLILAAIGHLLGSPQECIRQLRKLVRVGGYIVIDDGYLMKQSNSNPRCEGYLSHEDTIAGLMAYGDILLKEITFSPAETKTVNTRNTRRIRNRADSLAIRYPELANTFDAYVRKQDEESRVLETELVSAVWLLQRT